MVNFLEYAARKNSKQSIVWHRRSLNESLEFTDVSLTSTHDTSFNQLYGLFNFFSSMLDGGFEPLQVAILKFSQKYGAGKRAFAFLADDKIDQDDEPYFLCKLRTISNSYENIDHDADFSSEVITIDDINENGRSPYDSIAGIQNLEELTDVLRNAKEEAEEYGADEDEDEWEGATLVSFGNYSNRTAIPAYCKELDCVLLCLFEYDNMKKDKFQTSLSKAKSLFDRLVNSWNRAVDETGLQDVQKLGENSVEATQHAADVAKLMAYVAKKKVEQNPSMLKHNCMPLRKWLSTDPMCVDIFGLISPTWYLKAHDDIISACMNSGVEYKEQLSPAVDSIVKKFPQALVDANNELEIVSISETPGAETYSIHFPGTIEKAQLEDDAAFQHLKSLGILDVFMPSIFEFKAHFPHGKLVFKFKDNGTQENVEQTNR